jgi:hypothetical protein
LLSLPAELLRSVVRWLPANQVAACLVLCCRQLRDLLWKDNRVLDTAQPVPLCAFSGLSLVERRQLLCAAAAAGALGALRLLAGATEGPQCVEGAGQAGCCLFTAELVAAAAAGARRGRVKSNRGGP